MILDNIIEAFSSKVISEVCKGETYNIEIKGRNYCKLAIDKKKINCDYLCVYVDDRGMRPCIYNRINK